MINIKVDEAYAFDMLSVLDIKNKNSLKDQHNYDLMCNDIKNQIGSELFKHIIESNTYNEMIKTNQILYDLIDMLRKDFVQIDAKILDDANIKRYKVKQTLQNDFFLGQLSENKTQI